MQTSKTENLEARFDPLDSVEDHFDVGEANPAVTVQVGHLTVAYLVDEDIRGVAELVPAVTRTSFTTDRQVVCGGPETRTNSHPLSVNAVIIQVFDHQLELVEEWLA